MLGNEFKVNQYTTHHQYYSSIGIFKDNGFVISWYSYNQDGSSNAVIA